MAKASKFEMLVEVYDLNERWRACYDLWPNDLSLGEREIVRGYADDVFAQFMAARAAYWNACFSSTSGEALERLVNSACDR